MGRVILTFPNGESIEIEIDYPAYKLYGVKRGGARPIKAEIFGEFSTEFIDSVKKVMHPYAHSIHYNDKLIQELL